jgi:phosphoribosylamine---glycine ligase
MKVFCLDMIDDEGCAIDIVLRAKEAGHSVRYWQGSKHPAGDGLVEKVDEWKQSMDWAELVILTGNCDYPPGLEDYFTRGYPIFGTNPVAAELELDRGKGQEILERYGVETAPYEVVSSPEEAIEVILKAGRPYALKPWGGEADKSMTCVPKDVNEALFHLVKWKKEGTFSGQLMMQEMVKGIEIGIAGYFGPGGWSSVLEESFEHKKFMNDDLGENTGEQGTVIRHVKKSKLFDQVLEPITDYLHLIHFVGDCNVNCIISDGVPYPLEFTLRLGWPDARIRYEVFEGDPVEWMADLIYGRDSLRARSDIAIGVVMTHGDYPKDKDDPRKWSSYPIEGVTEKNWKHLHFQQVMDGKAPRASGGRIKEVKMMVTAGTYPLVVSGSGARVRLAQAKAYSVADEIRWPSNVMYRTDIGERLKSELEELKKHGYATDLEF